MAGSYRSAYLPPAPSANTNSVTKQERPGLGTKEGSEVYSSVNNVAFYRKSVGSPDVVDSFHYNDEEGAKAMLGGEDAKISSHQGRFDAANKLLSVALLKGNGWSGSTPLPSLTARQIPDRRVVVGTRGSVYRISLQNKTKKRIEVVASVDGIDVLDGKSASVNKRGYVLKSGEKIEIAGFRKNQERVREFQFGSVAQSAAAQRGESAARNVGVIGLAVWQEDQLAALQAERLEAMNRIGANPFGNGPVAQ